MLKKEFKRKDVNRARNLLTGKTNASTGVQIGYSTKQEDHKEGDVWTEGKKTWTIKNGIKQTVSKLDVIKEIKNKNSLTIVDEMESYLLDAINTSNSGFVSEDGVVERWVGGINKVELTKQVKETVKTRREYHKKELDD